MRSDKLVISRFVVLVLVHLTMVSGATADELRVDEIVERVRAALGISAFEKQDQAVVATGEMEMLGLAGSHRLEFDSQGRFARSMNSRVPTEMIFDGNALHVRDIDGTATIAVLGDRTRGLAEAWAISGMFFSKDHLPEMARDEQAENPDTVVLRFGLDEGRERGRVTIDRATWIPRRWKFSGCTTSTRIDLDGQVTAGALRLPATARIATGSADLTILHLSSAELKARPDWTARARSLKSIDDTVFLKDVSPRLESKLTSSGHILVHPKVAGRDYGWFIFDTGAGQNILDKRTAKQGGFEKFGKVAAIGVGGETAVSFCRPESLELGPVRLKTPLMSVFDLSFLDAPLGEKIAGIIGFGTIARCVVELEQSSGSVSLHDPASFELSGATWRDLLLYNRVACLAGRFEGHDGLFRIDTGGGGWSIVFHQPTVDRLRMLDDRKVSRAMLGGVGGMKPAKRGRIRQVEIGGTEYENMEVAFATATEGAFADPYVDGNIGSPLLSKHVIILDYPHSRAAFRPCKAKH